MHTSTAHTKKHKHGTPYMILDLAKVREQYHLLKTGLRVNKIYYAVKCNPDEKILETLKLAGSFFEVASFGEVLRLQNIGVSTDKITYSNPVKPLKHIVKSYKLGVRHFAYDSKMELDKLSEGAPGAFVHLRLTVSNKGSLIDLSDKFGAPATEARELFTYARELKLKPIGITFHVGSQAESPDRWEDALHKVKDVYIELTHQGFAISAINIGGGFPANYATYSLNERRYFKRINQLIEEFPGDVEFWCEPGRYLVAEAGVIVSSVIGKTERHGKSWVYLDVGRFQAFVELFESEDIKYPVVARLDNEKVSSKTENCALTGPSCDAYDTIFDSVELPIELAVGDKVEFGSTGAYTLVYGSAFNDFPIPVTRYKNL